VASYHSYFREKAERKGQPAKNRKYVELDLNSAVQKMIDDDHFFVGNDQCHWLSGSYDFKTTKKFIRDNYLLVLPVRSVNRISGILGEFFHPEWHGSDEAHANRSASKREAISPEIEAALHERTHSDQMLYKWILERENKAVSAAQAKLRSLLKAEPFERGEKLPSLKRRIGALDLA
jgi:hypothetical protein